MDFVGLVWKCHRQRYESKALHSAWAEEFGEGGVKMEVYNNGISLARFRGKGGPVDTENERRANKLV